MTIKELIFKHFKLSIILFIKLVFHMKTTRTKLNHLFNIHNGNSPF